MTPLNLVLQFTILLFALYNSSNKSIQDCVIINGGGYSGFWYYYGYLQNNKKITIDKTVYCYSSGCLAYVALLTHNNSTYLYKQVNALAIDYNNNKLTNYDVKEQFINTITRNVSNLQNYNLNILTTNYAGQCIIKQPKTTSQLISALDETTNIPVLTTKLDFNKNLDGGLCYAIYFNKYCSSSIMLPYKYRFYSNIFNKNLSPDDISYFMDYTF